VVLLVGLIGAGTGYYFWKSPPRGAGTPPPSATGTVTPTPPAPPPALDQTAPAVPYVPPPAPVVVQPPVEPPPAPIAPPAAMPDMAPGGPRWPWTAERLITNSDLRFLEARDLELMRNEIYARHGWVFKRQDLQQYFQSQPWYRPKGSAANREEANRLAAAELNPVEKRNVQIIQYHEKGGR
jgi:type IV secretory pathway VirB10-like protein